MQFMEVLLTFSVKKKISLFLKFHGSIEAWRHIMFVASVHINLFSSKVRLCFVEQKKNVFNLVT